MRLKLSGPKSLISNPVLIDNIHLDMTWHDLLTNQLKLQIRPGHSLFVTTMNYKPNGEQGWRSEIQDEIGNFVSQYSVKRRVVVARIRHEHFKHAEGQFSGRGPLFDIGQNAKPSSSAQASMQGPSTGDTGNFQQQNINGNTCVVFTGNQPLNLTRPKRLHGQSADILSSIVGHKVSVVARDVKKSRLENLEGKSGKLVGLENQRSFSNLSTKQKQPEKEEDKQWAESENESDVDVEIGDGDDDNDIGSLITGVTAEYEELRHQGIPVRFIKSMAERRFAQFSNAHLLRIQNEILKLKNDKLWERCVMRAPLICYCVDAIFKTGV